MNLEEKLLAVQKIVDYFKKDKKGYKYNYVSGSSILGKIKAKKDELGLLLYPEIGENATVINDGDNYVFNSFGNMVWEDVESQEKKKVPFYFTGKQNDPSKAFGSALTYSERYFLLKFFGVPTDEIDPDKFQEDLQESMIDPKAKAWQKGVIDNLTLMYKENIDNFKTFKRIKNSIKKHLGVEINKLEDIRKEISKISDVKKLEKYADHLIEVCEKEEEK